MNRADGKFFGISYVVLHDNGPQNITAQNSNDWLFLTVHGLPEVAPMTA